VARILSVVVPDDLMRKTERLAEAEGKTIAEIARDALRRHVELTRFRALQRQGRRAAEELRIGPDDVEGLVDQVRAGRR